MSDIAKLRERVQKATGPDRELFIAVCESLLGEHFASENQRLWGFIEAAAWTDAALALVERVGHQRYWVKIEGTFPPDPIWVCILQGAWEGRGVTLPLAILSALLAALEAAHEQG